MRLMRMSLSPRLWIPAMLAAFFVLHLPILATGTRAHPDEQYYTDAAIRMVQTGDYVTPTFADGSMRFNKPILTYWAVVAGFRLFGIGIFASRILFLIAGCLIPWIGYLTARVLFRDRRAAFAAAVMLIANDELRAASLRANPDILLCLGFALAFLGFARILFGGSRAARDFVLGYGGVGLAVASKGLLGVALLAYLVPAATLLRRRGFALRSLLHWPAMLLGLAVAGFWFLLALRAHGPTALQGFFTDQVGSRFVMSHGERLGHVASYLAGPLAGLLPWSAIALLAAWPARAALGRFWNGHRAESLFALGWCALLIVVFSVGNMTRPRYLLPAFPLLAAWLGAVLVTVSREPAARRVLRAAARVALAGGLLLGLFCLWAGFRLDPRLALFAAGWIAALLGLLFWSLRRGDAARCAALGALTLYLLWGYDAALRPILGSDPAPALAARLDSRDLGGREVVAVGVPPRYLSRIRVLSGGRVLPRDLGGSLPQPLPPHAVAIVDGGRSAEFTAAGYRLEPCGHSYRRVRFGELWEAARRGDMSALRAEKIRPYFLALPE